MKNLKARWITLTTLLIVGSCYTKSLAQRKSKYIHSHNIPNSQITRENRLEQKTQDPNTYIAKVCRVIDNVAYLNMRRSETEEPILNKIINTKMGLKPGDLLLANPDFDPDIIKIDPAEDTEAYNAAKARFDSLEETHNNNNVKKGEKNRTNTPASMPSIESMQKGRFITQTLSA